MDQEPVPVGPIVAVAALAEPTRRSLYDLVAGSREPVGRDDAAGAIGISRELAAFHLDRLVEAGLLATEFHRRSGRTGPGAGRPAKFYRRAERELEVSLPPRRYDRAAEIMATALQRLSGTSGIDALVRVARERGMAVGTDARSQTGRRSARRRSFEDLVGVLRWAGYEPDVATDGAVCLRNCPYQVLATEHRDLTCGMNVAWAEGVVDGLGVPDVSVEFAPEPGRCCVIFHAGPEAARAPA